MADTRRLSIFPLGGAVLLPRAYLPLHIFEPRYRALVQDSLARDRRIGMIQPREGGERPALFDIGCIGRIMEVEALEDGRFNLILEGLQRFRLVREREADTAFRQVDVSIEGYENDSAEPEPLASIMRAAVEREAKRMAIARGFEIDWSQVERLDDEGLVNGIAQVAPFDIASRQALLEAVTLADRADLLIQFLTFFTSDPDGGTLQ